MHARRVCFSARLFDGYSCTVDLDEVDSCEEIVACAVEQLKAALGACGLAQLAQQLHGYHIHAEFGALLLHEEPIYVCQC